MNDKNTDSININTADNQLVEVVRSAATGNQSALTKLYELTYNDVYNTALFLLKDEDTALDIMQDSYIKAFSSLDTLTDQTRFLPWIKRIVRNLSIDQLRKKKPVVFSAMMEDEEAGLPDFEDERTDNSPEAVLDQQETGRLIREILDSLPDAQRSCITLYYYEEMSVKEIAEELGVPEATVKSRLQYGRKKIEAAVRDLEKKGTKLYGIAPFAFFLQLLRNCGGQLDRGISEAVLSEILGKTLPAGAPSAVADSSASATSAANLPATGGSASVAGEAVTTAGAAAHTAIGIKAIAGIVALLLAVGGLGVAIHHHKHATAQPISDTQAPLEDPSADAPTQEPLDTAGEPGDTINPSTTQASGVSAEEAYTELLKTYRNFYEDLAGGADVRANSDYATILSIEYIRFDLEIMEDNGGTVNMPYCAFVDINNDGVDELILATAERYDDIGTVLWRPFEVYTFDGETAVPLVQNTGVDLGYYYNIPNIHIMPEINGLGLDYGNGLSPKWFFTLAAGEHELNQINYFEANDSLPRVWVGTSGDSLTDEELDTHYPNNWNYDDHGYVDLSEMHDLD